MPVIKTNCTDIESLIEKNSGILANSFVTAVQKAVKEYGVLKATGQKGELSYIYVSFLLSGVICKLPWFRIDLYDENDRRDLTECYVSWDVPEVAKKLYDDFPMPAFDNNRPGVLTAYEIEHAWLDSSENYFNSFLKYIPKIISKCGIIKGTECKWFYGQFMGKSIVVWGRE